MYQSFPLRPQRILIMGAGTIKRVFINALIKFASIFSKVSLFLVSLYYLYIYLSAPPFLSSLFSVLRASSFFLRPFLTSLLLFTLQPTTFPASSTSSFHLVPPKAKILDRIQFVDLNTVVEELGSSVPAYAVEEGGFSCDQGMPDWVRERVQAFPVLNL